MKRLFGFGKKGRRLTKAEIATTQMINSHEAQASAMQMLDVMRAQVPTAYSIVKVPASKFGVMRPGREFLQCTPCGAITHLDEDATSLCKLGMYPFKCPGCGSLRPAQKLEDGEWIRTYIEEEV